MNNMVTLHACLLQPHKVGISLLTLPLSCRLHLPLYQFCLLSRSLYPFAFFHYPFSLYPFCLLSLSPFTPFCLLPRSLYHFCLLLQQSTIFCVLPLSVYPFCLLPLFLYPFLAYFHFHFTIFAFFHYPFFIFRLFPLSLYYFLPSCTILLLIFDYFHQRSSANEVKNKMIGNPDDQRSQIICRQLINL